MLYQNDLAASDGVVEKSQICLRDAHVLPK
jgi:hypothetical protein